MSFVEINILGVLVSPLVPLMALAFAITLALRVIAVEFGWTRRVWHPALLEFSVFLIILAATVVIFGHLRIYS